MALCTSRSMILGFIAIFNALNCGLVSSIDIQASPKSLALNTNELNVTCTGGTTFFGTGTVLSLQLQKKGQEPIAAFVNNKISYGPGREPNMLATSDLDSDKNLLRLQVSVDSPGVKDTGTYECVMIFMDETFRLKENKAYANVHLEDLDVSSVVARLYGELSSLKKELSDQKTAHSVYIQKLEKQMDDRETITNKTISDLKDQIANHDRQHGDNVKQLRLVMGDFEGQLWNQSEMLQDLALNDYKSTVMSEELSGKISVLEKTTQDQGVKISTHTGSIRSHENQIREKSRMLRHHQREITKLDSNSETLGSSMARIKNQLKIHSEDLKALRNEVNSTDEFITGIIDDVKAKIERQESKQDDVITRQTLSMKRVEKKLRAHDIALKEHNANDSYNIAFLAGYNSKDKMVEGTTLKLTNVQWNIGNAYDPIRGVFTAPKKGLYDFSLIVDTLNSDDYIRIALYAGDRELARLYGRDKIYDDQSTISVGVILEAGEEVKPIVRKIIGATTVFYFPYSYMSGHLVKLIH